MQTTMVGLLLVGMLGGCSGSKAEDSDDDGSGGGGLLDDSGGGGGSGALIVDMETTLGSIAFELDAEAAPVTVENFLAYVDAGFYDGQDGAGETIFHRVIAGFVVQGGGYTASGTLKDTLPAIVLESDNGLSNVRGTLAMARTGDPDSATSQFYVNLVDNTGLDYQSPSSPGYAVFGEVVAGLDVIDDIAAVTTDSGDRPTVDVRVTACARR